MQVTPAYRIHGLRAKEMMSIKANTVVWHPVDIPHGSDKNNTAVTEEPAMHDAVFTHVVLCTETLWKTMDGTYARPRLHQNHCLERKTMDGCCMLCDDAENDSCSS